MLLILYNNLQILVFALNCCVRCTSALFQGGLFHVSTYTAQLACIQISVCYSIQMQTKINTTTPWDIQHQLSSLDLGFSTKISAFVCCQAIFTWKKWWMPYETRRTWSNQKLTYISEITLLYESLQFSSMDGQ